MKFVFPHFEDKNLDRWMMAPKHQVAVPVVQQGGVSRPNQDLALSEALQRFHIASCKTALSGATGASCSPTILLPPILMSSNANTWLSTRSHKRVNSNSSQFKSVVSANSNAEKDLSKWLVGSKKAKSLENLSEDFSKWLKKSVPAGSSESSLPGKRVEFPDIPLSAFRRVTLEDKVTSSAATSGSKNEKWLHNRLDKWLAVPTTTTNQFEVMDVEDEEEDDDDNLTNQWLLVERTILNNDPVRFGSGSSTSIESWLMSAAADRDPSIVVISDDEDEDDIKSGFSGNFANLK